MSFHSSKTQLRVQPQPTDLQQHGFSELQTQLSSAVVGHCYIFVFSGLLFERLRFIGHHEEHACVLEGQRFSSSGSTFGMPGTLRFIFIRHS